MFQAGEAHFRQREWQEKAVIRNKLEQEVVLCSKLVLDCREDRSLDQSGQQGLTHAKTFKFRVQPQAFLVSPFSLFILFPE